MSKLSKAKKVAIWLLKEPVIKITVGKHTKQEYFVIDKTVVYHRFTNKKDAIKFCKDDVLIEGAILKSVS